MDYTTKKEPGMDRTAYFNTLAMLSKIQFDVLITQMKVTIERYEKEPHEENKKSIEVLATIISMAEHTKDMTVEEIVKENEWIASKVSEDAGK